MTTGSAVASFVLVRYGEATHTVDNDQRRTPLAITSSSGDTYQLAIPSDPGIALPGPYMLFAIGADGTPSVSATVAITTAPASPPTSAYAQRIDADGPALYWPLSDVVGSASAGDASGNGDVGTFSTSGITFGAASPVEGATGRGITLSGGQVISSEPQEAPTTYSEELWFETSTNHGGLLATYADGSGDLDRALYMTTNGQLVSGVQNGQATTIESPGSYADGRWHFAVATQGGDGVRLYVDGQLVASGSAATAAAHVGSWQLGGSLTSGWPSEPAGPFSGAMSDAAVFEGELTASQVGQEYTTGVNGAASVALSVALDGAGSGTVSGGGLTCPGTCDGEFARGTQVTLTATASAGSTFGGWNGPCSGTGSCEVTLSQDQAVTATFAPNGPPTPTKAGTGTSTPKPTHTTAPTTTSRPSPTTPSAAAFAALAPKVGDSGSVTLRLKLPAAGRFTVRATFVDTVKVTRGHGAHRHTTSAHRTFTYAHTGGAAGGASTAAVTLSPTRKTLTLARSVHSVRITLLVTFTPTGGSASRRTEHVTVAAAKALRRAQRSSNLNLDVGAISVRVGAGSIWECGGAMPRASKLSEGLGVRWARIR